jgi:hypothetical protein
MKKYVKVIAVLFISIAFLTTSIFAGNKPKITDTKVNLDDLVIEVYGKNFTSDLKVSLNDTELKILECSDTEITARLWKNIESATYRLVLTGPDEMKNLSIDVTIGEPESKKPKKPKELKDGEDPDGAEAPEGDKKEKEEKKPE